MDGGGGAAAAGMFTAVLRKLWISWHRWKRSPGSILVQRLTTVAYSGGSPWPAAFPAACGVSFVTISWMTAPKE